MFSLFLLFFVFVSVLFLKLFFSNCFLCFVLFLCSGERAAPAFALIVLLALMARVPSFECVCVCVCVCRVSARIVFFSVFISFF